jgi:hypothetical protein
VINEHDYERLQKDDGLAQALVLDGIILSANWADIIKERYPKLKYLLSSSIIARETLLSR